MDQNNVPQTPQMPQDATQQMPQQAYQQPVQPNQPIYQQPMAQAAPQAQPVATTVVKSTSGMGVAALVLGILSFLASFIPLLNLLAVPLVLLGLLFALIGLISIKRGKTSGKGVTMAGLVLCLISLLIIVGMYAGAYAAGSSDSGDSESSSSAAVEQGKEDEAAAQQDADANDAEEQPADEATSEEAEPAQDAEPAAEEQPQEAAASGGSYESIYEDYAAKIRDATPGLVEEYNNESAGLDLQGKADLCAAKIEVLAEIEAEGTEKMAENMLVSGLDYGEYEEWSMKLYSVYEEEASKITSAYMANAM